MLHFIALMCHIAFMFRIVPVFVPTENPEYTPDHHADIMAKLGEFPTEEGWTKGGLDKYGLVAVSPNSHAVQLEKVPSHYITTEHSLRVVTVHSLRVVTVHSFE